MIRHTQRHTASIRRRDGHTIDGTPGDCFRATVASILDEPDDLAVPHFVKGPNWWGRLRRWSVEHHGVDWRYAWDDPAYERGRVGKIKPGYVDLPDWAYHASEVTGRMVVVSGHSPRGSFLHSVVGNVETGVVWDPHPSRAGLLDVTDVLVPVPGYWAIGYPPPVLALPAGEHRIHTWERWDSFGDYGWVCRPCGATTDEEPPLWVKPMPLPGDPAF